MIASAANGRKSAVPLPKRAPIATQRILPWRGHDVTPVRPRSSLGGAERTFRNVQLRVARSFRVTGRRRHYVFADGEAAGKRPAEYQIVPGALDVMVPQ